VGIGTAGPAASSEGGTITCWIGDGENRAVAGVPGRSDGSSETVLDAGAAVLWALFVAFLFLGYLDLYRSIPFTVLAAVALFGSLAILFTANWRADRRRSEGSPASGP